MDTSYVPNEEIFQFESVVTFDWFSESNIFCFSDSEVRYFDKVIRNKLITKQKKERVKKLWCLFYCSILL